MAVVHESAHQGGGHLLIVEYIDPAGELQVRVEYDGFALMYLGEIVKQQLGAGAVVRHISPFIQLCGSQHNWIYVESSLMLRL